MKYLDWPKYRGEKSLAAVAGRVIAENAISRSDAVAGSSLGGMVALEIARILGLKKVYLFGSAVSKSEINPLLRLLAPLCDRVPLTHLQALAGKCRNAVLEMFSSSDADFIRSMCRALKDWQGFKGDPALIVRVHGKKDKVLFCHSRCKTIEDGGHLIAMTHPFDCIDAICHFAR